MGDHSRRSRSRSRSPSRRHRDHEKESRSSHSSKHKSHKSRRSDDEDDDRKRRHRKDREETEEERKQRKRAKKEKRRGEQGRDDGLGVVDDDDDGAVWVEKGIDAEVSVPAHSLPKLTEQQTISNIPTSDSLALTSQVERADAPLPHATVSMTQRRERDAWMLEPDSVAATTSVPAPTRDAPRSAGFSASGPTQRYGEDESAEGNGDFFASFGTERKRKDPNADKPDPTKPQIYKQELNTQLKEGKTVDEYEAPQEKKTQPGGPGSQWRMMKLKRLYEQAEEQ